MLTNRRVLIVDDEGAARVPLQLAFESAHWRVDAADAFEAAMRQLGQERYDLVITDKNLPTHDGIDLVRAMRKAGLDTPVFVMTGFATTESALEGLHLGIEAYIQKPFDDIFAVVTRAGQLLERRDRERQTERIRTASTHFSRASAFLQGGQGDGELRVVIANANRDQCNWLTERLAPKQARVDVLNSASALLSHVAHVAPDLAIIDLELAAGDTQALLDALGRGAPEICCIVSCERPELSTIIHLIELRVHAVLEKPFRDSMFGERVLPALEAIRRRKQDGATLREGAVDRL